MDRSPEEIVRSFVDFINAHNVSALARLMTEDHLFVDSVGNELRGREEMRKAWVAYFYIIPDFTITIIETFQRENTVALFGVAHGTYSRDGTLSDQNRWKIPAAWKAVVRDSLIAEWHIFADNEPVRQIIGEGARTR